MSAWLNYCVHELLYVLGANLVHIFLIKVQLSLVIAIDGLSLWSHIQILSAAYIDFWGGLTKATRFDRAEKCKNINLLAINGNKNQKIGSLSIVIKYKKIKILYHMKTSFFIKGDLCKGTLRRKNRFFKNFLKVIQ